MKFFFIPFVFCFFSTCGLSQKLPLTVYSAGYGSIQNGASHIFQDSKGWMYFMSGIELMRYDGHRFKTIYPTTNTVLDFCYRILEMDHEIWIMSKPYPLIVSGDSLIKHPYLPANADLISGIKYNGKQYFSGGDGLYLFENKKITRVITHSIKGNNRNAVFKFNDSLLIGNYYKEAVFVFNMKRMTVHYYQCNSGKIQQDERGNTFIHLLDKGIVQVQNIRLKGAVCEMETTLFHPLVNMPGGYFIFDNKNNSWAFSSHKWLVKISPDKKETYYKEEDGFPGFVFLDMFKDRENNIWLAMTNGVCKITEPAVDRYTSGEGLPDNHVDYLFKVPGSKYMLAVTKNGTSVFDGDKWRPVLNNNLPLIFYKTIFTKNKQYLLADSILSEVSIDYANAKVIYKKTISVIPHGPLEMDADSAGIIYITTFKGIYRYFNNKLTHFLDSSKIGRSLLVDSHNRLWIGGFGDDLDGYQIYYNKGDPQLKKISYAQNLTGAVADLNSIRSLVEDEYGNMIAGTLHKGLYYLTIRNDSIIHAERLTVKNGLLHNTVRQLKIDTKKTWWLVTDNGINSVSGIPGNRIIKDEGAPFGITRASSLLCSDDGTVWIGNYPGVAAIKKDIVFNKFPFAVYITGVVINNNISGNIAEKNGIKLDNNQNTVSISFSATSFINEKAILYSYQLQNNGDTGWSVPAGDHQVNYSALKPGSYTFRVKAINQNGQWSTNTAGFNFSIKAPFWQRGWFIGLLIMMISGMLFALYRYRIRQLTKLQSMRNNISHNLHDDIGASLTNILILNEMTKKNIDDKVKATTHLSRAGEDIRRISESLSDIVWNISPRYDDLNNLFIRMKRYAAEMLEGKNIEAAISFPEKEMKYSMPMDQRRDFYLLFKEVINNMAKHSGASMAEVSIEINNKILSLTVEDNGKGFDIAKAKNARLPNGQGNGLNSIKQRADKWNASLDINSEPGKGTVISLKMKI